MEEMLESLNWIDYIILGIIGFSVLMGMMRGFVREAMSLITWIMAIIVGVLFCEDVSFWFSAISMTAVRILLSFVLLVLATLIVGGIISHLIGKIIKTTNFSMTDHFIGTFFGFGRGAIIIAVLIIAVHSSKMAKEHHAWKEATLIPHFEPLAQWVQEKFPMDILDKLQPLEANAIIPSKPKLPEVPSAPTIPTLNNTAVSEAPSEVASPLAPPSAIPVESERVAVPQVN